MKDSSYIVVRDVVRPDPHERCGTRDIGRADDREKARTGVEDAMNVEWFVACRMAYPRQGQQGTGLWPASVAHAKRMGETTTACGERAFTMKKLFEMPFPVVGENCSECMVAVAKASSRRVSGSPPRTS